MGLRQQEFSSARNGFSEGPAGRRPGAMVWMASQKGATVPGESRDKLKKAAQIFPHFRRRPQGEGWRPPPLPHFLPPSPWLGLGSEFCSCATSPALLTRSPAETRCAMLNGSRPGPSVTLPAATWRPIEGCGAYNWCPGVRDQRSVSVLPHHLVICRLSLSSQGLPRRAQR